MSGFDTIGSIQMTRHLLSLSKQVQMDQARMTHDQADYDRAAMLAKAVTLLGILATVYYIGRRR
ncbi:hypothetical protein BH10PLA2_BH10PLA2_08330 [soil metagenome]